MTYAHSRDCHARLDHTILFTVVVGDSWSEATTPMVHDLEALDVRVRFLRDVLLFLNTKK
jgi:hypothetical protein